MAVIESRLEPDSEDFRNNAEAMQGLVDDLHKQLRQVRLGGGDEIRMKHLKRGKMLPRDRVTTLLDKGSEFLEISALAAHGLYDGKAPSAGLIAGIGKVHGRDVMVVANDATVKGGTYFPMTVKKHLRAQEVAAENHLPCVYLVDSGGAFLPLQDEVFPDRDHFGRIFFNQANMSAKGIPQVAVPGGVPLILLFSREYIPVPTDQCWARGEGG